MDHLDIRILRQLSQAHTVWPAKPGLVSSYRGIARQLGASPGTVRNRIRGMVRTGFLREMQVYVNPTVLGLSSGSYAVEVPPDRSKAGVIDRLGQVEGVVFFENFHGTLLGIGLTYPDDHGLQRTLAQIDGIVGSTGVFSRVEHPPSSASLAPSEWTLVARLMRGRFLTYPQLARENGLSVRTLKRRLARLVAVGAILTFPRMDYRALLGGVTADLLVSYGDAGARPETRSRILRRVEEWLIFAGVWEDFEVYRLILPNVPLATHLAEEVGRMEEVRLVRAELVDGVADHFDGLRSRVEQRAAAGRDLGPPWPRKERARTGVRDSARPMGDGPRTRREPGSPAPRALSAGSARPRRGRSRS